MMYTYNEGILMTSSILARGSMTSMRVLVVSTTAAAPELIFETLSLMYRGTRPLISVCEDVECIPCF